MDMLSINSLPEDVAAYLKYKKETGRGFEDFSKLNRDIESIDPDKLLRDYLTATEKGLDAEDIESLMEDYSYDEEIDEKLITKIRNYCKKKSIQFLLSNNIKLAIKLNLDGVYIPSFNKDKKHLSYSFKKNFACEHRCRNPSFRIGLLANRLCLGVKPLKEVAGRGHLGMTRIHHASPRGPKQTQ